MTGAVGEGVWRVENTVSDSVVIGAVIQGQIIHVTLPPKIPLALSGLPRAAGVFTGRRADLDALLGMLDPDGPGGRLLVSVVAGMAGVGKTELVLQASHQALRSGWFPGGALFVDLAAYDPDRRRSATDVLSGWLTAMGVPGEYIPAHEDDRARLWRTIIEAYSAKGKRVLLVIDNAADTGQVATLLPADVSIPVLVTSRHTLDLDAHLHRLHVLDPDPATKLITEVIALRCGSRDIRLHDEGHQQSLNELAKLCEGLPLALRIIAALLADRPHLTPTALAMSLRNEHRRLDQLSRRETTGEVAVRAAFDLSYQELTAGQARVFRLLPTNPGPTIATTAAAHLADLPELEAEILLQDLHRAHLVEEPVLGRWRQHDLLRLHATTQAVDPDEAATAHKRLLTHYLTKTGDAGAHLEVPVIHPLPAMFSDRNHALTWLDAEHANLIAVAKQAADSGNHHTTVGISFALARYQSLRRRFNDALTLTTHALAATRALHDRHREGQALNNFGNALQEVRRFEEAITAHQQAAEIYRELGDLRGEGRALNNLGVALREVRRFEEAITAHQQAAEIFRELGDRHGEGQALGNLGIALWEVRRFEEAVTTHESNLAICRELDDRHGESRALNNLGIALQRVQRFEEAITAHESDLAICRELDDRHSEGRALGNLGVALEKVQRFEEAITAHEGDLAICRELDDRHSEGQALNNLGNALREAQRFEGAITAHQQAAEIFRAIGDRHGEGRALGNLGKALRGVRRFEEVRKCWTEALVAFSETGDDQSATTVTELLADLNEPEG